MYCRTSLTSLGCATVFSYQTTALPQAREPIEDRINFLAPAGTRLKNVFPFAAASMTQALIDLLRRREAIIADHSWRDRDSAAHLDALRQVSEQISAWTVANDANISPKLRHYLANSSFQKALDHLEPMPGA